MTNKNSSGNNVPSKNFQSIEQVIRDFSQDASRSALEFPPTLGKDERAFVHSLCEQLGLSHQSFRAGSDDASNAALASSLWVPPTTDINNDPEDHISRDPSTIITTQKKQKQKKKKYEKIPIGITEVLPGFLYLGSAFDASDVEQLQRLGITHILNVAQEWDSNNRPNSNNNNNNASSNRNGPLSHIVTKMIGVKDEDHISIDAIFPEAFEFINSVKQQQQQQQQQQLQQQQQRVEISDDNNNNNNVPAPSPRATPRVLVHCIVGKSRSASVVLGYLMQHCGMDLKTAFEFLSARRSFVRPNDGFMRQLIAFEKALFGTVSPLAEEWEWGLLKQIQEENQRKQKKKKKKPAEEDPRVVKSREFVHRVLDELNNGNEMRLFLQHAARVAATNTTTTTTTVTSTNDNTATATATATTITTTTTTTTTTAAAAADADADAAEAATTTMVPPRFDKTLIPRFLHAVNNHVEHLIWQPRLDLPATIAAGDPAGWWRCWINNLEGSRQARYQDSKHVVRIANALERY